MNEEDKKDLELTVDPTNVQDLTNARIKRMKLRGHMMSMYEEFEILRIKFIYDDLKDRKDAIRFVTLLKYFMENGPSEAMRLNCKYMHDKYLKKFGE